MASNFGAEMRRPLPVALALLAAIGWIAAIVLGISRASVERHLTAEITSGQAARVELANQLEAERSAAGELSEIQNRIASANAEHAALTGQREAVQAELVATQSSLAELQQLVEQRRSELAAAETRAEALNQQIEAHQAQVQDLQTRTGERTQELSDVGQRLEGARAQEAQTRNTVSQLTQEAARLASDVSQAEQRAQQAREAEAGVQEQLEAARLEFSRMAEERTSLEQGVAELSARREQLMAEINAAGEQRAALQSQVTELANNLSARTDELANVERRIADLQREGAALSQAAAVGVRPGEYKAGPLTAFFASDGSFRMSDSDGSKHVTGRYSVESGILTLSDAVGATGGATFPVRCQVEPQPSGFRLLEVDRSCSVFSGVSFAPTSR